MPVHPAWPPELEGTPAIAVIEKAISSGRLCHALLLQGEDLALLQGIAEAIASRLLNGPRSSAQFPPAQHPDCFFLRATGKMRQIGVDPTRELISKIQVSPAVSLNKVALIVEADRMNLSAANIFLKTLEEPPAGTTILLLTTRPYALLPTIRSRVQYFRFPASADPVSTAGWSEWMADYQAWLSLLASTNLTRKTMAGPLFKLYGLIARFSLVLSQGVEASWGARKGSLPADLADDERTAIETGLANGLRARLFADIERATRGFAMPQLAAGEEALRRPLIATVDELEHCFSLLTLNLNEATALEHFLIATLRIWSRR